MTKKRLLLNIARYRGVGGVSNIIIAAREERERGERERREREREKERKREKEKISLKIKSPESF